MAEDDKPVTGDDDKGAKPDDKNQDPDAGAKSALVAERNARREAERQARELADRLKAIEDKDKSEVERLTEQVATLTKERDAAVGRADRLEVAIDKSLDEDKAKRITTAAKRLTGSTREELEADADEFLSAFSLPAEGEGRPAPAGRPQERLKPGNGDPDTPIEETDVKKLGERMFAR